MVVGDKYIRIGSGGELLPVKDCYAFLYDHADGKLVLRISVSDSVVSLEDIETVFSNADNKEIYSYIAEEVSGNIDDTHSNSTVALDLKEVYTDYCKALSYSYKNGLFEVEIDHKLENDISAENNSNTSLEISDAIVELLG